MSIRDFKRNIARLTDRMITFSLNPDYAAYKEILACTSLVRESGEFFPLFMQGCMAQYGRKWGCEEDPHMQTYHTTIDELLRTCIQAPTYTAAMKLLYTFYATGSLDCIEVFYQCMGHESMPRSTKDQLRPWYENTRAKYQAETARLLRANANHFAQYKHIREDIADFSYFDIDKINARVKIEREKNSELRALKMDK